MAKYNEILVGRFNRFLQKFLSMKGGPPASQLSGDIQAQFQLDDANYLENRFTASWRSYGASVGAAAGGAGNRSAVAIANPAGSGVIAIIEKLGVPNALVDFPVLTRAAVLGAGFTAGVAQGSRDSRIVNVSTCLIRTSVNSGAFSGFIEWEGANAVNSMSDAILTENQELVLMPGDNWTVFANTLNQAITVNFFWRERALEEGEVLTGL